MVVVVKVVVEDGARLMVVSTIDWGVLFVWPRNIRRLGWTFTLCCLYKRVNESQPL